MSENYGIAIFLVSIFQTTPSIIRRKIIALCKTKGYKVKINEYNHDLYTKSNLEIQKYRSQSLMSYGRSQCQRSPTSIANTERKRKVIDFLKLNKTFNMIFDGVRKRCRIVSVKKRSALIEISGDKMPRYIQLSKIRDYVQSF